MTMYITPYRRLAHMRDAMERMFEDAMPETHSERELLLALDVQAEEDDFVITALVPGLDAEDIELEVLNNTVTIRGAFKNTAIENAKYLMSELPSGNFSRSVTMPVPVDAARVEATIRNGILTLRLPKAEAHRPKAIKVVNA